MAAREQRMLPKISAQLQGETGDVQAPKDHQIKEERPGQPLISDAEQLFGGHIKAHFHHAGPPEGDLSGPVQAAQPHHLMGAQLEGEAGQHVLPLAVPGAEVLNLQDVPAHGQRSLLLFFSFFQAAKTAYPKAAP